MRWGQTTVHADGQYRPFVWSPTGETTLLERLPGTSGHAAALAINDRGDVVGISGIGLFLWARERGMRDLGLLPGNAGTHDAWAAGVSRSGQAVGTIYDHLGPRPVLFVSVPVP